MSRYEDACRHGCISRYGDACMHGCLETLCKLYPSEFFKNP
jgi:hypothetical protein